MAVASYDYVICGGGTAGLVLASRLTEVPSISVAVIEAGIDRSNDTNVLAPGLLTALYGNPDYDWIYQTTPQAHANERVIGQPRGKQLGGSSAINYLAYTHASRYNIDSWSELGNEGWTWDELEPYYRKEECFRIPPPAVADGLNTSYLDLSVHGTAGEIRNGFPNEYGPLDEAWPRAYETIGLGASSDPRDGLAIGGYTILTNLDNRTSTRSYAANTYLTAAANRTNLHVYTNALVTSISIESSNGTHKATGVNYSVNGTKHSVSAKREVLLSAGSYGSPQILELSGVGDEKVLQRAGIEPKVCNEHVGENLQDHAYMPLGFSVNPGIFTLDDLANETTFNNAYDQYLANATGPLAEVALGGALLSLPQIVPNASERATLLSSVDDDCNRRATAKAGLQEQYAIIKRILHSETEAIAQHMNTASGMNPELANDTTRLFAAPTPGNYFTILAVLEHPFSRGSVHINSSDASTYPVINPNYFSHPADIKILSKVALQVQNSLAVAKPLSDLLQGNGTVLQPEYIRLTEDNVEDEIRRLMQSEYHPAGSCAMMPKDKGGVVDGKFRVYGVEGLRVVDASVIPMLPRANLQTLVYALAERAAEWIRKDHFKEKH